MATAISNLSIPAEEFPTHLTGLYSRLDGYSFADFSRERGLALALEGVKSNFDNQRAADGQAWEPRKPVWEGKRVGTGLWRNGAYDGHPLLILTTLLIQSAVGNGPGAITYIEDQSLTFGVDGNVVEYAGVHEYGDHNGGRPIPARPYMGVPEEQLDAIGEALADYLLPELFG